MSRSDPDRLARPRFDWRSWLALAWAAWFGLLYARMVLDERAPALAQALRRMLWY